MRLSHWLPEILIGTAAIIGGGLFIYIGIEAWAWADTALFNRVAWATAVSFAGTLSVAVGALFLIVGTAVILDIFR